MKEIEFWIDGTYYREKEENITIFQKCFEKKINIPCFCYYEKLSITENHITVSINRMKIETKSLRVKKARENRIKCFYLLNYRIYNKNINIKHELQKMLIFYGYNNNDIYHKNNKVSKESILIEKMIMTRCIHRIGRVIKFINIIHSIRHVIKFINVIKLIHIFYLKVTRILIKILY